MSIPLNLYRVKVDLVAYESDFDVDFSDATREKYRNPIYTTSLFRASALRSQYGEAYVNVSYIEVKDEWESVNWEKINEISADVTKNV